MGVCGGVVGFIGLVFLAWWLARGKEEERAQPSDEEWPANPESGADEGKPNKIEPLNVDPHDDVDWSESDALSDGASIDYDNEVSVVYPRL